MIFVFTFNPCCARKLLPLLLAVFSFWQVIDTCAQGSRPIEFSKPRDADASTTNSSALRSERRSLSDLEDRLSKTLDLFHFDDSLGGAPAFRVPPKSPTAPQRSRPLDRSTGKYDWLNEEALISLPDFEKNSLGLDAPSDVESADPQGSPRPTLLDSLRGNDWLVRGTLGKTFWELPVMAEDNEPERTLSMLPTDLVAKPGIESTDERFVTQMDGFMNKHSQYTSPFETPIGMNANVRSLDVSDFEKTSMKSASEQRREQYRDLLGMNSKPVTDSAMLAPLNRSGQTSFDSYSSYMPATSMGATDTLPRGASPNSLYPVRSTDRSSIYENPPNGFQRPNEIDVLEVEQPAAPSFTPDNRVSNPMYQPPRRQF